MVDGSKKIDKILKEELKEEEEKIYRKKSKTNCLIFLEYLSYNNMILLNTFCFPNSIVNGMSNGELLLVVSAACLQPIKAHASPTSARSRILNLTVTQTLWKYSLKLYLEIRVVSVASILQLLLLI